MAAECQNLSCVEDMSDPYDIFYTTAQYITGLIAYPILCIIGIAGNIVAGIVFAHREMRTSTNVYLLSLAVSDTIKLLNDAMYFIIVAVSLNNSDLSNMMTSNIYPMAHYVFNMSVCVTSWLTVSVAVDRYILVCHASRARELCTIQIARIVCTVVFIFMGILTVPTALRYEMRTVNDTVHNKTCSKVVSTVLGCNKKVMEPYYWIISLSRATIPVIILVYLNARIINELRKERVKGKQFSARNRITLMLIVIVFMFLVCISPDAIMSFAGKGYIDEKPLFKGVREITDTLLAVNSAFNFFLYFAMSTIFRSTFIKIFCQCYKKATDPQDIKLNRKFSPKKCIKRTENPEYIVKENGCTTQNYGDDNDGTCV